jgi:hypothetical protein
LSSTVSHKPHQQAAAPRTMATPKYSAAMSPELSDGCPFESGGVPGAVALALWCVCGCGWICDGIKIGWLIWWIDRARRETLHWLLDHDAVGFDENANAPRTLGQFVAAQRFEARAKRDVHDDADVEQEEDRGPDVLILCTHGRW